MSYIYSIFRTHPLILRHHTVHSIASCVMILRDIIYYILTFFESDNLTFFEPDDLKCFEPDDLNLFDDLVDLKSILLGRKTCWS